ncbi:uncharacterized protein pxnb isoform X2 [Xyrauchen texanus]|uniref:uncharacterized protein pxnb isoform X2 n=1 Tax=Xyrauchen texanus TaxID=154827 RepID=UPI002241E3DD|nr:uncharacterized protein pxnb isoform X2 [Xyrauchen texanus]
MDDLDALLADLESSTAHISKCPVFLPEETPYSNHTGANIYQDDSLPPPLPPPPSAEALNGSLSPRPDSQHSSEQSLGSAHKSTLSRDSSPPASNTEEDHVYSFPNKQKHSDSSAAAMTSALGSNLSELDRLLLELNAVQQNAPSYSSTEDAAPPLPPCSVAHYIQENGAHPGIMLTPATQDIPQRNGTKGIEDSRPTVESLLNELETSVPSPMPIPCALTSDLTDGQVDTPSEQQGRISATSATRELDELMACLSDFKPSSLGSLNSEPLFEQTITIAEIHPAPATLLSKSLSPTHRAEPSRYSPGLSSSVNLELHIVEDSGEPGTTTTRGIPKPAPSPRLSPPVASSPRFSPAPDSDLDSIIEVSASLLSSQVESLVVLSQNITTTTTKSSFGIPGGHDSCPVKEGNPSVYMTNSVLRSYSPFTKSPSPTSAPVINRTPDSPMVTPASIDLFLSSSEPKPLTPSPIPSIPRSTLSALPAVNKSPVVPFQSIPKAASSSLVLPSVSSLSVPKSPSPKPSSDQLDSAFSQKTLEPSLNDALDKLLAMSFNKPEMEAPVAHSVSRHLNSETQPEIYEETIMVSDRSDFHPDTHTESEVGDGLLEDQSDCRSDLDWADMELKMAYEGPDGSMTPMTEASWMDDSLTPSSCPGTPDAQMDLPMLYMAGTMDRISASGHVRLSLQCLLNENGKNWSGVHPNKACIVLIASMRLKCVSMEGETSLLSLTLHPVIPILALVYTPSLDKSRCN